MQQTKTNTLTDKGKLIIIQRAEPENILIVLWDRLQAGQGDTAGSQRLRTAYVNVCKKDGRIKCLDLEAYVNVCRTSHPSDCQLADVFERMQTYVNICKSPAYVKNM